MEKTTKKRGGSPRKRSRNTKANDAMGHYKANKGK